jgi:transcriptional regulator
MFAARSNQDVLRLVETNPLAWLVAGGRGTLLPLRAVTDGDGRILRLRGHFARSNPHVQLLRDDPRALLLFLGPHGYISPSWMQDRAQAPTWNYASAQIQADIAFFEGEAETEALLADLIGAMEAGRDKAWRHEEMGARYASLSRRIIGFDAHVRSVEAKFKLGQDERRDVFADITGALAREPDAADLLQWMLDFQ